MSRHRDAPKYLPYLDNDGRPLLDDDGQVLEMKITFPKRPAGITGIKASERLLEIWCPENHFVAVVMKSDEPEDPRLLVVCDGASGVTAVSVVYLDGLSPLLGQVSEDGRSEYSPMGDPAPSDFLTCHSRSAPKAICPQVYLLDFAAVRLQLERSGISRRRVILTEKAFGTALLS